MKFAFNFEFEAAEAVSAAEFFSRLSEACRVLPGAGATVGASEAAIPPAASDDEAAPVDLSQPAPRKRRTKAEMAAALVATAVSDLAPRTDEPVTVAPVPVTNSAAPVAVAAIAVPASVDPKELKSLVMTAMKTVGMEVVTSFLRKEGVTAYNVLPAEKQAEFAMVLRNAIAAVGG